MVELNFGKEIPSPKGEFDLQSYASFEEIMQAIQNKIPVSKEALYTRYKLPRPKNSEDEFVLPEIQNDGFALSDKPSKKKDRFPARVF